VLRHLGAPARVSYAVPPQRLERWLARWVAEHGPVERTDVRPGHVTFSAADGAQVRCEPPFPPLAARPGERAGYEPRPLLEHVGRDRVVGVLLVRLGGHAAGVFAGRRLVDSKVGRRQVHGRHRAGGSSQRRFERRRAGQARVALEAAADLAARVLLPLARDLDAVVLGGDRRALAGVLEDPRLRALEPLTVERVLDVPDPRLEVLRRTPDLFLATVMTPSP
jgi:Actinobacteria/chloroflexi VLRF1 release factor